MSLKYRISNIGWYNFELLVQTLLKTIIGPGVTSFGGSKDDGRDALFTGVAEFPTPLNKWKGKWVFQVKYVDFEERGVDAARSSLRATLRKEIKSLSFKHPDTNNYILLTDVPLTAQTRDELDDLVSALGFGENFASVDGKEICEFLDMYGDIRKSYPQLLGLADLDVIVNRDLYARSHAYLQDWQPRLATYVQTEAHMKALSLLNKKHFIVLDGPPEAGKTTIAAAIALMYATDGFEIIDVRSSNDVFRTPDETGSNKKQRKGRLFIADDAIGSITLEDTRADAWSRDLRGIMRTLNDRRLLIWTARRYILEEAIAKYRLKEATSEFPHPHEVLVEVGELTKMQKAEMLYNHAKQSDLSTGNRELIKKYAGLIVNHPNFSPLRISQLTSVVMKKSSEKSNSTPLSVEQLFEFLNNPGDRWIQAFRCLSPSEQLLLSSTLDFDGPVPVRDLRAAYELRASKRGLAYMSFEECVRRLDHSFLSEVSSHSGEKYISVQHPSLSDMLLLELRQDAEARRRYIALANPFGLARVIGGIAEMLEVGEAPEHSVVPENEEEFQVFLERLRGLSQGPLTLEDWDTLLTAAERLIPSQPGKGERPPADSLEALALIGRKPRIEPIDLDLDAFASLWKGKIIRALLEGFASRRTFENSQRFMEDNWVRLLRRFYYLSGYMTPPIYPSFTASLCRNLRTSIDSIRLANVINSSEPLVLKQTISRSVLDGWEEEIEREAENLAQEGERFSYDDDPNDFDDWDARSKEFLVAAKDFVAWGCGQISALDELESSRYEATRPVEPESDDADVPELPESGPYWTVQRLFEDL